MTFKNTPLIIIVIFLSLTSCKVSRDKLASKVSKWENFMTKTDITEDDIRLHIGVLASDEMKGRESGSPDEALAAEYIKNKFESLGLKAFNNNYIQTFSAPVNKYVTNTVIYYNSNSEEKKTTSSQNVIAYMEASNSKRENDYILIGAHYDHIGTDAINNTILINNGADDNASGVAGMLEIAEKLLSLDNFKYNVIFVAFGAEELGLVGSYYFCNNPPVPLEKIKFMYNLDMIGRMDSNNGVYMNTIEPNDNLSVIVDAIKGSHTEINTSFLYDYYLRGSDHTPFFKNNIPVISFTTGIHSDYHKPSDVIDSINFGGQKLLLDFVYDMVISPAMDEYIRSFTSSSVSP